ncbi:neurotrypsin-like [Diadema antillarum]|uniref:neurotrypsin-like n=1 Tax=Diadema antillarum TaxID=105358 RepID=UPI003A893249
MTQVQDSVRLVGGSHPREGRVEIYFNGAWGTVCDDLWDIRDATVVCRSLGFTGAELALDSAPLGEGTGDILLDHVSCTGKEVSIFDCVNFGIGVSNCEHEEDAGVICTPSIRLVDGNSTNEGRVEVYANGTWGTVCDDSWDITDAGVVCRSLGFTRAEKALSEAHFGEGSLTGDVLLDDVSCSGTETSIFDCANSGIGVSNCAHTEDAGVRCNSIVRLVGGSVPNEGRVEVYHDGGWGTVCNEKWNITEASVVCRSLGFPGAEEAFVRLVGGNGANEGRVEVYAKGAWGTVCDDFWDITDAGVVCRSLGFEGAEEALKLAAFGEGTGDIWLDTVACIGVERDIFDCGNKGIGVHNCRHIEDAGVRCTTK